MNRSGFTLVELMIATMIALILSMLLFTAIRQIRRFIPFVDSLTQQYETAALINAQLERDLSGTTAPTEFYFRAPKDEKAQKAKSEEEKKKIESQNEKEKKGQAAKEKKSQEEKTQKEESEKSKKPLEKIFYGTVKNGMLDELTFVTTNPLQVYWSAKAGSAKPRAARVRYTLKEEKQTKKNVPKSYSLSRQESSNLEYDQINQAPEIIMASNIKSVTVEYTQVVQEEKKEGLKETAKKSELKKNTQWLDKNEKEAAPQTGKEKEEPPLVPQLVEFTISLWDIPKKRSTQFSFPIKIRSEIEKKKEVSPQDLVGGLKTLFSIAKPSLTVAQSSPQNKPNIMGKR